MSTHSTIPAVRQAIIDLLAAAVPYVQVTDGRPPDAQVTRSIAIVGDISSIERPIPVSKAGRKSRDEIYDQDVVIICAPSRGTNTAAMTEAVAVLDALDDAVSNDVSLGSIDGVGNATLNTGSLVLGQGQSGPICVIEMSVHVVARLN